MERLHTGRRPDQQIHHIDAHLLIEGNIRIHIAVSAAFRENRKITQIAGSFLS